MKYLATIYPDHLFEVNGKKYMKTAEEANMVEAFCITDDTFTCFWIWTKVREL